MNKMQEQAGQSNIGILEEINNEIKGYREILERLAHAPSSIRYFAEVFERGLELVEKRGIGRIIWGYGNLEWEHLEEGTEYVDALEQIRGQEKTRAFRYKLKAEGISQNVSKSFSIKYWRRFIFDDLAIVDRDFISGSRDSFNLSRERGYLTAERARRVKARDSPWEAIKMLGEIKNFFKFEPKELIFVRKGVRENFKYGPE